MAIKVYFFDKIVREFYYKVITAISTVFSLFFIFVEIPKECKICTGFVFLSVLVLVYIFIWIHANKRTKVKLNIDLKNALSLPFYSSDTEEFSKVLRTNCLNTLDNNRVAKVQLFSEYATQA